MSVLRPFRPVPPVNLLAFALAFVLALTLAACGSPEEKAAAHVAKARELMAAEEFKNAKLEAKSAVQIQPKNAEANLILAQLAWSEGDFREAFPRLQMAVEGDPEMLEARLRLGDLYATAGDVAGATEQLEAARKIAPDTAEVHLLAGRVLFANSEFAESAVEIDKALALDPGLVDAINIKASLFSGSGNNAAALAVIDEGIANTTGADQDALRDFRLKFFYATRQPEAYEAALKDMIQRYPDKPDYRYQLLDFYASQGRAADQEAVLRELLEMEPDNEKANGRLANLLISRGDVEDAEKLLKDSIARNPESVTLQITLGDFYRFRGRSDQAMAAYKAVAAKWPDTTAEGQEARNRIIAQQTLDGDIPGARAGIDALLKVAPDNADALLSRATFSFLDRNYEAAIADLRTVLRREKSADALLLLARSYVGAGDAVVAKDTYRRLLGDYPNNADGAKELAVLLSDQGDSAAAADILRRFVATRPDDAEASAALVQNLLAQRNIVEAQAEAQRMVTQGTGGVAAEQAYGAVLQAAGSGDEALARYRAVLDKDPGQAQALEGLVNILLEKKRAGEAIAYLERYPKGDIAASLLLGKVYASQGDVASARQVINHAIADHPADARPYLALAALSATDSPEQIVTLQRGWKAATGDPILGLFLASSYERQGKYEDAIAVYEEVYKQDRASPAVVNNLASLLLDHRSDKASLAKALELAKLLASSADATTLDTLGWAYYRNGNFPDAVRQLERAAAAGGDDALVQYHLGMAYISAGNPVSARQHLSKAVELSGEQEALAGDARAALARLGG